MLLGEQALAVRLQRDHALALVEHHAAERHHALAAHGVADDGEGLDAGLVGGTDVETAVVEALVDLRRRYEAIDLDGVVALELDLLELGIGHMDIFVLGDLVALAAVLAVDRLARLVVD
jgi:hypothetical protein